MPKIFFDDIDGTAFSKTTAHYNRANFDDILLRQRVLRDVANFNLAMTIPGRDLPMPVMLRRVGCSGLFAAHGEAQADHATDTPSAACARRTCAKRLAGLEP
ncbi:alpha-hydroxy-acid oxidizing protein [Salipiger pallidus]|uniref:alpha-hydroxy-acid oxidizing protein n=1 Tax=Salipiger pallidus TaxID=1775170 RepID=UPI0035716AD2